MASIKKNFFYQSLYEILLLSLPLLTSPYISRVLGAQNLGIYSLSYAVAYYFQLCCMLGIKYHGTRIIAAVKNNQEELNKRFSELLVLHLFVSLITNLLYILYVVLIVKNDKLISLIQLLNVFSSLLDISWFYFGIEKFKVTSLTNSLIKIISVIFIFLFVKTGNDLWKYTLIISLSFVASQLVMWLYLKKYTSFVKVNKRNILEHLKPMLILFFPIVAVSLFRYMDKIVLGFFSTRYQIGLYENADKIIMIPSTIIISFSTVMLPRITNLNSNGQNNKALLYTKLSFKYLLLLSIGMAFGLAAVSDIFSVVFWGDEFVKTGKLIEILSFSIPFTAYSNILRTQYLMPKKKDKTYFIAIMVGAIVNIFLNLIFVRKYEAYGVAFATLISEIFVCVLQILMTRKEFKQNEHIKSFLPFYLSGFIMFFILKLVCKNMTFSIINLILKILFGFLIYFIVSSLILIIQKDEFIIRKLRGVNK